MDFDPDSVTNVALANMAPARIKGRATGSSIGDPQDLTPVQVRAIINVADGATAAGALGDSHASAIGNPHQTSAKQVGAVPVAEKGVANGVATLDATGKVPAAQLPPEGGGAITSVFGRTGAIVAKVGDYSADQIADTAAKVVMTAKERSKLASIESAATADQTGAEIVTAINTELGGTTWQGGGDGSFAAEEIVQLKRYAASAEAYTATATNVGATSDRVHWKGSVQGSLTLSTNLAHKRVTVTNKGTAPVNVVTGLGTFTLPVAAEPGQPSSFCFSRETNAWQMV